MKLPRYPKYKDSGVKWLGQVPEHWEISVLKRMAHTELSNIDKNTAEGETSVKLCNYLDVYRNEKITAGLDFMVASASDEQISRLSLQKGDVIITKDSESPDDIGVPAFVSDDLSQVVCGYHLALMRPYPGEADGLYIARAFKSKFLQAQFSTSAVGMTRFGLGKYGIENVILPKPPREEQTRIAEFLDHQLDTIDALTSEQEQLIELLKEKRQAIISHAVTKGLNPNAPMKPSGIGWIGDIPAHWGVERTKWLFMERDQRSKTGEEEMLTVSHLTGVTPRSEKNVTMFEAETNEGYKLCHAGDLVINTLWAWMGAMGIAPIFGMVSPAYNVYAPGKQLWHAYVDSLVRMPLFAQEITRYSKGVWTSRLRLYPEGLYQAYFPVPPRDEQKAIAEHIANESTRIESLMLAASKSIELLQEHRSTLISAAVTGQIDVRGEFNAVE